MPSDILSDGSGKIITRPAFYSYSYRKIFLYSKLHFKMQKILRISYTKILAQGRLKALLCSAYLLRSEF